MRLHPHCIAGLLALAAGTAWAEPSVVTVKHHWRQGRFEVGPRLSYLGLTDVDTGQALPMAGVGGYLRYRLSRRFGLETSLDMVFSDELGDQSPGEVTRVSTPFTASGMFYLFPRSRLQLYFLAGIGAVGHTVKYDALGTTSSFITPVGQLGVGTTYRTDDLRFDLSFRSMTMTRDGEDLEMAKLDSTRRPVGYQPLAGDRTVTGAMLTFGVHWGW